MNRTRAPFQIKIVFFCLVFIFLLFNDELAVIVSAISAYLMVSLQLVALRTFAKIGCRNLPICCPAVSSSLGNLTLWYCHLMHLP